MNKSVNFEANSIYTSYNPNPSILTQKTNQSGINNTYFQTNSNVTYTEKIILKKGFEEGKSKIKK